MTGLGSTVTIDGVLEKVTRGSDLGLSAFLAANTPGVEGVVTEAATVGIGVEVVAGEVVLGLAV